MPQRSEFKVFPERLGAAGETISSCRSKVETLAESLADVQRGLKGSASSIGLLEKSVASLQENIRYQAKRMDQAAACVKFSASTYSNAERTLLGQPLLKTNEIPSPGTRPSPGISMDEVKKAAGREIEGMKSKNQGFVSGIGAGPGGKPGAEKDAGSKTGGNTGSTGAGPGGKPGAEKDAGSKTGGNTGSTGAGPGGKPGAGKDAGNNAGGNTGSAGAGTGGKPGAEKDAGSKTGGNTGSTGAGPGGKPGAGINSGKTNTGKGGGSNQGKKNGTNIGTSAGVGAGAAVGAAAAAGRVVNGYRQGKSEWDWGTLTYKRTSDEYGTAYVEKRDGEDVVTAYEDRVSKTDKLTLLGASKLGSYRGDTGGDWADRAARKVYGIEKVVKDRANMNGFERKDPKDPRLSLKSDWSDRVWEREKVPKDPSKPDGPQKGQMKRILHDDDKRANAFSKDIVGAKLFDWKKEVSWEAFGAKTEKSFKHGSGSAGISVAKATAGIGASAGAYYVFKNGQRMRATGAEAKASASFSAVSGQAEGQVGYAPDALRNVLGKDFSIAGVEGSGEGKIGHVEATGGAKARYVDGKLEASLEGEAGAYAAKGSVSGKANLLGIKVGAGVEANVGIGITAKAGFSGGKLRCEFGACLGLGAKLKFEIDVQGAVDAVKNGAVTAAKAVGKAAVAVGNAIVSGAKAVGKFFSSW